MKKLSLLIISALFVFSAQSQNGNNICVWNALNNYNQGGGAPELERGMKCSDEAIANPETEKLSKTWWYRAQLMYNLAIDKEVGKKYPTAAFEALKAFKQLNDLNDPKFKDWEDAGKYMVPLSNVVFNSAIDQFQAKNYAGAFQMFYAVKDLNAVLTAHGGTLPIDLGTAMKYAAISAENAGDNENKFKALQDWIAIKPEGIAYQSLVIYYKKAGNKEEAQKALDAGLAKFPNDASLLIEKINFFLEADKPAEAMEYINKAIEAEPKNDMLWFVKGVALEKGGKAEEIIAAYTKASEINPKNFKAWYNMGAYYYNQAAISITDQMNKLGNTKDDLAKYEELKKKRADLFLQAKPFFLKAKDIDPDDAQNNRALKQIDLYTAQ